MQRAKATTESGAARYPQHHHGEANGTTSAKEKVAAKRARKEQAVIARKTQREEANARKRLDKRKRARTRTDEVGAAGEEGTPMAATLTIDHVTLAWSSLEPLESALAALGLRADYGGKHANRSTHMDVLGFDDGSYLELIAPFEPGTPMAWEAHMRGDAGPCAWAISLAHSEQLAAEAERLRSLGIAVRGPMPSGRTRPDGQSIAWEYAFVGEGEPGATLPFLIADRTPRELRVRPSASVSGTELPGWSLSSSVCPISSRQRDSCAKSMTGPPYSSETISRSARR